MDMIDSAFETLREAILLQAVRDYKAALKTYDTYSENQIKRFFVSEWGQLLSEGTGERIIMMCEKSVIVEPKRGKAGKSILV